jgi:hypothetical protein
LERVSHKVKDISAYAASPMLLRHVYGGEREKVSVIKVSELAHALACNKAAMSLMRYSFVSGLSLEHELSRSEISAFCHDRRPDGIVQITRPDAQYELALEVESSVKGLSRVAKILDGYQVTFESGRYPCAGVIIVATNLSAYRMYRERLLKVPASVRERVLLHTDLELPEMKEKFFGTRLKSILDNPHLPQQKTRSQCEGEVQYLPMKSIQAISLDRNKAYP